MKKLSAAVVISVLILSVVTTFPHPNRASTMEDCSCSAPDGTCSASISCPRGCIDHCVGQGDCYAECSGAFEMFGMETTLQLQNGTYPQLVASLARVSGRDIAFSPTKPDAVFNADYKKALLWDVFDMLSERGTVQIAGKDFEKLKRLRKALLSGMKISLCVGKTPVSTFVNDMASLTGLSLRIASGKPMAVVNIKLQEVSLDEILAKVSEQTGTKIVEYPNYASIREP
jgi:hypothetical protein